jgi:DNA repair protein SbcC/Rad50
MCYREEQNLDFSGIHLACLAGDNGHGKSTLLDAMTWALWGQSRARRDDELISLGENDMWVEFEFGMGGQRYRVWRQRSRKGRGQSDLHFYVWNTGGDEWLPIDEGGLVERQAQITRTLRMDYNTFTNSAFLLQGRADSFTVKTPGERKQILAEILGLGRYDEYEARAKDEAASRKAQAERIEGESAGIDRELARRPVYEAQLAAARATVSAAGHALHAAEAEQTAARLNLQSIQDQARQAEELRGRLARAQRDLADSRQQLAAVQARLNEFMAVLAQRAEIEAGWEALKAARQEEAGWNTRLIHHTALQEGLSKARLAVHQARLALENDERRLRDRLEELNRRAEAGQTAAGQLAEVTEILAQLSALQERRETIGSELRETTEESATLRAENERMRVEGQGLREKIAMLGEAAVAACPLCGQPLTTDHRDQMVVEMNVQLEQMQTGYHEHQVVIKTLTTRKADLEKEDADLARELRVLPARQRQAATYEAAVADGQAAQAETDSVTAQLAALATRLEANDYAPAEQAELARLETELAESGYDSAAHRQVRVKLSELEPFDARYQRQLIPALEGIEAVRGQVETLTTSVTRREEELAEDQTRLARLTAAVQDLPTLEARLAQATREVERAAGDERRARQEEGAAMQQLNVLAALTERRNQLMTELAQLNQEISVYNQLREAFGKKGLQAMIIESAIPEIETEANRLLGRMSEGRMSLRLETQREKVAGEGVIETLDIIISDELGARPYQMFSGGETFRANLALRIAISKLLARRAGAQLQTLVIDEGFGTQDAQGRALLVEAISSIQHDFERILVITHIEELKDLFPARIDVTKTANGSHVAIA